MKKIPIESFFEFWGNYKAFNWGEVLYVRTGEKFNIKIDFCNN